MTFATYGTVKTNVMKALDLEDETFIQASEMLAYCNEAIHQAESIILKLCEDYFLSKAFLDLTANTAQYSLPTDIYADKIRKVIYYNSASDENYNIKRLRYKNAIRDLNELEQGDDFFYLLTNDGSAGIKMNIYPTPSLTENDTVTIWYIRNANRATTTASVIDIPEFSPFIEKYMKVKCMEKEGHPLLQTAQADLEDEKQLMISSLQNRVADEDDSVEMDMNSYWEAT